MESEHTQTQDKSIQNCVSFLQTETNQLSQEQAKVSPDYLVTSPSEESNKVHDYHDSSTSMISSHGLRKRQTFPLRKRRSQSRDLECLNVEVLTQKLDKSDSVDNHKPYSSFQKRVAFQEGLEKSGSQHNLNEMTFKQVNPSVPVSSELSMAISSQTASRDILLNPSNAHSQAALQVGERDHNCQKD